MGVPGLIRFPGVPDVNKSKCTSEALPSGAQLFQLPAPHPPLLC